MKVIYGTGHLKLHKDSCVSVGVFDGVHRGHQSIIKKTVSLAKKKKFHSIIVTFYPHPDSVIYAKKFSPLLMSLKHRLALIASYGVDMCIVIRFDGHLRRMSARTFVADILVKRCRMKEFIVNRAFAFGKHQQGGVELLKNMAQEFDFLLHLLGAVRLGSQVISSTAIRSLIAAGKIKQAAALLGRDVEVIGTVVGGDTRGKRLGIPTANIDPHHEVIPLRGVYVAEAFLQSRRYYGVANIGFHPTFREAKQEIIELHILRFKRNIYGCEIRVIFKKRLRNERKFLKKQDLLAQIGRDIEKTRQYFSV